MQYEQRDFKKEAKGKTFSLLLAGLVKNEELYRYAKDNGDTTSDYPEILLHCADKLLEGIDKRGYF